MDPPSGFALANVYGETGEGLRRFRAGGKRFGRRTAGRRGFVRRLSGFVLEKRAFVPLALLPSST
jgi:hypothetical protein